MTEDLCWGEDEFEGLRTERRGDIVVRYPASSFSAARQVMNLCVRTRAYLAPLFGLEDEFPITVLWLDREWWPRATDMEYSFPANTSHGEVLPAVDVEHPEGLARIAGLLDLESAPADEVRLLKRLVGLYPEASDEALMGVLQYSPDFYLRFVIHFILPHEICHAMNNAAGTPREPWWIHEFQAQMAAILTCRELGFEADARLFELYYRLMYLGGLERVGETDVYAAGQKGPAMGIVNYAWYHGALVQMHHEIEEQSDELFGERLLRLCRDRATGRREVSNAEFTALMSEAAEADLSDYMVRRWGIE
ncbi:MAG: hypothetical protein J7M38_05255 [Armatimonadetes bacterium]|nr:hypothetical protein [Armatimonadota bacterium]